MKKFLVMLLAVLVVGISSLAMAGDGAGIAGSLHDLSALDTATSQICVFCHTPHDGGRASVAEGVLWNHEMTTETFVPYSSVSIDGVSAEANGQPVGTAKMCLSCHDGSVALDSFGGVTAPDMTNIITVGKIPQLGSTGAIDLRGTHPISINFDNIDPQLGDITAVTMGQNNQTVLETVLEDYNGLKLIQCMSCHDVHNTDESIANTPFLRADLAGSAICLKCHIK